MPERSVIVITRDTDVTADLVMYELASRDVSVLRFDLADFPERMWKTTHIAGGHHEFTGSLVHNHHSVDLDSIQAIWYRKPSQFQIHEEMTDTEHEWAAAEASNGLGGVLTSLPNVRWINHPHRSAAAELKPHQLATAAASGLTIPDTLITNDPDEARSFCHTHRKTGVVYKPMRGGPGTERNQSVVLRTTMVTEDDITDGVRRTAHLFQTLVDTVYAVRVTIVGSHLFAVRLDTPPGTLDWREIPASDITYTPVSVPDMVANGIHQMMTHLGLVYAAPDFLVDRDGLWWFIGDLNPNGQWAWIAGHARVPIASTIADELIQET